MARPEFSDAISVGESGSGKTTGRRVSKTKAIDRGPGKSTPRYNGANSWVSQRDIDGLVLCGEHYGAPYDLLGQAMGVKEVSLWTVLRKWRLKGLAANLRFGQTSWIWLTPAGMEIVGLKYTATQPALGRLAHIRAVLAARLWLSSAPAWSQWQPWWQSERRIRLGRPRGATGHIADAEIHWPDIDGSPYGGRIWGVEVELTPKTVTRTADIMTEMLSPMRYSTVAYLVSPAARPMVVKAANTLAPDDRARLAIRDLPETAFGPETRR